VYYNQLQSNQLLKPKWTLTITITTAFQKLKLFGIKRTVEQNLWSIARPWDLNVYFEFNHAYGNIYVEISRRKEWLAPVA